MNPRQKMLMIGGLVAIAATTLVAPYRWTGQNELARVAGYPGVQHEIVHRPIWTTPDAVCETVGQDLLHEKRGYILERCEATLDAGQLGLWWAGITALTIVAVLLAA